MLLKACKLTPNWDYSREMLKQFSLSCKFSPHHNHTVVSSFMSHPYILTLRRHSYYTTSTDSYPGLWLLTTTTNQLPTVMNWHDFVPTCHLSPLTSTSLLPAIVPPHADDIHRLLPVPPTWAEIKGSDCEKPHTGTGKQEVEPGSHRCALIGGGEALTSIMQSFLC